MPTGKVSWFGGPQDSSDSGHTASGGTTATPGVALYSRHTLGGYWRVRFPNGRTLTLKQTDIGPAPWTGRKVDVTYSALKQAGYTTGNFPTDANVQYSYLGKNPPRGGTAPQQAARGGSGATTRITKTVTPGVDNSALRNQLKFNYLSKAPASPFSAQALTPAKPLTDPLKALSAPPSAPDPVKYLGQANAKTSALLSLAGNLQGAADVAPTTRTVTQRTPSAPVSRGGGGGADTRSGSFKSIGSFDGHKMSAPLIKILQEARRLGWRGTVTDGFRTYRDQVSLQGQAGPVAAPGTSMHEFGRAFDVNSADAPSLARLLPRIAQKYPWARAFQYAGSKDPVHFSFPKGGRY